MNTWTFITLVIMMNLLVSMTVTFVQPNTTWEDWADTGTAGLLTTYRTNTATSITEDNLQAIQGDNTQEPTGGFNSVVIGSILMLGAIVNLLFGSITSLYSVASMETTGLINALNWILLIILGTINMVGIGLLFQLVRNKKTD